MKNKLSIIIVDWNSKDVLVNCLKLIKKYVKGINFEVIVVDNNSSDSSVSILKKDFTWVKLIANDKNLGFSKANNQGLKIAHGEYALILNPDVYLLDDSINKLIDYLDINSDVIAAAPLLLNADKSIQKKGYYRIFPSLHQAYYFYTHLYVKYLKNTDCVKKYWETEISLDKPTEVDQIPGACLLAKLSDLKRVGFFNEKYFIWFEDVDLCFKLKKLNKKLMILPDLKVIHIGGASFEKWRDESVKQARFFKSLFTFFDENKNYFEKFMIRVIIYSDLIYLLFRESLKQLIKNREERRTFILAKWGILKSLLV